MKKSIFIPIIITLLLPSITILASSDGTIYNAYQTLKNRTVQIEQALNEVRNGPIVANECTPELRPPVKEASKVPTEYTIKRNREIKAEEIVYAFVKKCNESFDRFTPDCLKFYQSRKLNTMRRILLRDSISKEEILTINLDAIINADELAKMKARIRHAFKKNIAIEINPQIDREIAEYKKLKNLQREGSLKLLAQKHKSNLTAAELKGFATKAEDLILDRYLQTKKSMSASQVARIGPAKRHSMKERLKGNDQSQWRKVRARNVEKLLMEKVGSMIQNRIDKKPIIHAESWESKERQRLAEKNQKKRRFDLMRGLKGGSAIPAINAFGME